MCSQPEAGLALVPSTAGLAGALLVESVQTALLAHGRERHSFPSNSQWTPVYPFAHTHLYTSAPIVVSELDSLHAAPFWHGLD